MVRTMVAAALALSAPSLALACGGKKGSEGEEDSHHASVVDPTHCAKKAELVGSNCSYSTGMMAQRVLEDGKPFTYTGTLADSQNSLKSRVAAPYTIGPENEVHVVANEVMERLIATGLEKTRITLAGRVLEVDGVQYFVATEFENLQS